MSSFPFVYSTFNSWNVVPMPSSPAPRDVMFHMNDSVGITQSPFTMQSQVQQWQGADWWELDVTLPPMTDAVARAWFAWFGALRGKANVFIMSDPTVTGPYGAASSMLTLPSLTNSIIPGQTTLSLSGLTPSTNNILEPGDYINLQYYLHMIVGPGPYESSSSGVCDFEIWPSVRLPLAAGDSVGLHNCPGLWRLQSNKRDYSIIAQEKLWTISFKAIEAR